LGRLAPDGSGQGPSATETADLELKSWVDLLGQDVPEIKRSKDGNVVVSLAPAAVCCLSSTAVPRGLHGDAYRRARARAAWAFVEMNRILPMESIGGLDWRALAEEVDHSPARFLPKITQLTSGARASNLMEELHRLDSKNNFPCVVIWSLLDVHRVT